MRFLIGVVVIASSAATVRAQNPVPVRSIGRLERVTTDSLAAARTALHMPGGNVLVNDVRGKRVLFFDSTLANPKVVADTTIATSNAYGTFTGSIFRFRGDSALYVDAATQTTFVISPDGKLGRVVAFPTPPNFRGQLLLGFEAGLPGLDAQGRLIYFLRPTQAGNMFISNGSKVQLRDTVLRVTPNTYVDTALIFRADLATRVVQPVSTVKLAKGLSQMRFDDQGYVTTIESTIDPLPMLDEFVMLPDGTLAVLRGADYHVDWLGPDGKWTSTPKMTFDWRRATDELKQGAIDSTHADWHKRHDPRPADTLNASAGSAGSGRGGGTGRGGGGGGGRGGGTVPSVLIPPALSDVTDYMPAFAAGALMSDHEGNIWVKTTTKVNGQPVYDVVSRRGEVFDRVQLPAFRTIAGFGPGVIYMAVQATNGVVRLERAKVK